MAFVLQISSTDMVRRSLAQKVTRRLLRLRGLIQDQRGAISTEYVIVVGTMSLLIVGALVSVGPLLLTSYERSRALLIAPFP